LDNSSLLWVLVQEQEQGQGQWRELALGLARELAKC
jgi:hypothetical protein